MDERKLQIGKLYRHFKGNWYRVTGTCIHSETSQKMVLYHANDQTTTWARPMDMFLSEVPPGMPNPTGQKYRFMSRDELGLNTSL